MTSPSSPLPEGVIHMPVSYSLDAEEAATLRASVLADLDARARAARARQSGADLIAAERQRQVDEEGWTPEHDASHDHGDQLARAAACYATPGHLRYRPVGDPASVPYQWPWEARFWKPTPEDRVRELIKAGALIAAEIDRLHAQAKASSPQVENEQEPRS